MKILINEKTKEKKRLYTGREIITAMGVQYESLHKLFLKDYDTLFDIHDLDGKRNTIINRVLFKDEKEFIEALQEGGVILKMTEMINRGLDKDKLKIKTIKDFRKLPFKYTLITIITLITNILTIIFIACLLGVAFLLLKQSGIL